MSITTEANGSQFPDADFQGSLVHKRLRQHLADDAFPCRGHVTRDFLGGALIGEELWPAQWVSAVIGAFAVVIVIIGYGNFPGSRVSLRLLRLVGRSSAKMLSMLPARARRRCQACEGFWTFCHHPEALDRYRREQGNRRHCCGRGRGDCAPGTVTISPSVAR